MEFGKTEFNNTTYGLYILLTNKNYCKIVSRMIT